MAVQIQVRRGTAAQWTSANPTLAEGELGVETDTSMGKIGDGATAWNSLAYWTGTIASHASTHQHGGVDEVATATPAANVIPKADGSGYITTFVIDASTTVKGKVELATDGESASGVVVQGNDSRLSDARTPSLHGLGDSGVHSSGTLAQINALINDATLIDTGDSRLSDDRDPNLHGLGDSGRHSSGTLAQVNTLISDATLIDTGDSRLSDDRDPNLHGLGDSGRHSSGTLAQVNALISDATLIDTGDSRLSDDRDPNIHGLGDSGRHSSGTLAQVTALVSDATLAASTLALTSGRVPYVTAGGLLLDTADFVYDDGNVRLGIGNSAPDVELHIAATGSGTVVNEIKLENDAPAQVGTGSQITWFGNSSAGTEQLGDIYCDVRDIGAGTEAARMSLSVLRDGAQAEYLEARGDNDYVRVLSLAGQDAARFGLTETSINEGAVDRDFVVKTTSFSDALFVDAGLDAIGVREGTPEYPLDVDGSTGISGKYGARIRADETLATSTALTLENRGNGTGIANDGVGLDFNTLNDAGTAVTCGYIVAKLQTAAAGSEDSLLSIGPRRNGFEVPFIQATAAADSATIFILDNSSNEALTMTASEISVNNTGADIDFRVEAVSDPYAFWVNAGGNRVAIGNTLPIERFTVGDGNDTNTFIEINCVATSTAGVKLGVPSGSGLGDAWRMQVTDGIPSKLNFTYNYLSPVDVFSMTASNVVVNDDQNDVNFRVEGSGNANVFFVDGGNDVAGILTASPSANADLTLGSGVLCLAETTTPTADTNFAKIYSKNDNALYFQDGAGTEHTVSLSAGSSDLEFGEIYLAGGSTAQSIGTGWTKMTGFASDGHSSANVAPDVANDKITINTTGYFKVECQIAGATGTKTNDFEFTVYLNGVAQTNIHTEEFAEATEIESVFMTGFIDVTTSGWDLDVRAKCGSTTNFTPKYMNLNVTKVSST